MPDVVFRVTLLGIAGCNFLLSLLIEVSIDDKRDVTFHPQS